MWHALIDCNTVGDTNLISADGPADRRMCLDSLPSMRCVHVQWWRLVGVRIDRVNTSSVPPSAGASRQNRRGEEHPGRSESRLYTCDANGRQGCALDVCGRYSTT